MTAWRPPGSVTDHARAARGDVASPAGTDPSAPSPRRVALPETPFGEPRAFASPELSRVTPVAPNARRVSSPRREKRGINLLSVFARMMAKVIVDAGRDVDEGHTDGERERRASTDGDASDADIERSRRVRGGGGARGHAGARVGLGASSFEESVLEHADR